MAIVKMKKFHLLVLDSYREELLRELQLFRNIQFEDAKQSDDFSVEGLERFERPIPDEEISRLDDEINRCNYVIDLIGKYDSKISPLKSLMVGLPNYTFEQMESEIAKVDYDVMYDSIKNLGDKLALLESQISKKREFKSELESVSKMDVDFNSLSKLKGFDAFVGGVSGKIIDLFKDACSDLEYTYIEEIEVYKDEHFFLFISDKREADELSEVLRIGNVNILRLDTDRTPKEEISYQEDEIKRLEIERKDIVDKLSTMKSEMELFKLRYEYLGNLRIREHAKKTFMSTKNVCVLSGYCPDFDVSRLEKTVSKVSDGDYTMEVEDVDKNDENVPILLKNNKFVSIFESITSTYALPKYNEVDPTPLYAPIYAFFFGMMSADVGYGVSLFILTTLGLKLCNLTPSMKKNVKFFQLLGIMTAFWGFLYGSYFGASIPGMWRMFDLSTQFMDILVISIIIGGLHLFYGLGIKAYMQIRDGQYIDMFFDVVAWYITLVAIICLLLSLAGVLPNSVLGVSKLGTILGIVLLVIGGARSSEGNIVKRLVAGLYNVYGISSYIGDFVSYSRLMALGMSGGYIAFSVNMIAGMVWGKTIIGYVAAIFILVFFHAFNLFLSCLGAYVHSLRLIYVEFFGKFYEGGGKAFNFFRNKTKYINLDRHLEE